MNVTDFTDALDELGIKWRERGQSLVVQDCPVCGSSRWKVHLRLDRDDDDDPFMGRCYAGSCQENYSSFKYLLLSGLDYSRVSRVHGRDPDFALGGLVPNNIDRIHEELKYNCDIEDIDTKSEKADTNGFFKISDWPEHPAAHYAASRGVKESLYDLVQIDINTSSVVFLVRDPDGNVIGWQKRFIKPANPDLKTLTSPGFDKSGNILCFPNTGNIAICEGPFTAVAAYNYGYYAICTFGAAISDTQLKKINDISNNLNRAIGLASEKDDANKIAYVSVANRLSWSSKTVSRIVPDTSNPLPKGFDLSDAWAAGMAVKEVNDDWGGPATPVIPDFSPEQI